MAYVNVREWSVDQVTDWMKGLDSNVTRYITCFLNNGVDGHQLLNLRVDDLEHVGVLLQGHQELILEAVELLRNFHYELDKENVQTLALRLVCAARSISRDLQLRDIKAQKVPTQTMSDVHGLVAIVKPLVQWLDRRPFSAEHEYNNLSTQILQYSYIMVHHTHRDTFAEQPLVSIIELCDKLIKIGNHIVQEVSDPMILQPATLDLANLKKKEQELGFYILASNTAVHQVAEIAFGSPAQTNSKIEVGDEIVQVNYQTIVGWQRKSVLRLLQLSSPDIVLTLKKRPRHTKMYGQIYMQPYRLPSKKRDYNSAYPHWNWNFDNIPSPRLFNLPTSNIQLTTDTIQIPNIKAPVITEVTDMDDLSESSSDSDEDGPSANCDKSLLINDCQGQGRLYPTKPRMLLQRRNTISGSTLSFARPTDLIAQFYQELKKQASSNNASASNIRLEREKFKEDSIHIRDKSVSCSHVLESSTIRPTTVIGGMTTVTRVDSKRSKRQKHKKLADTTTRNEEVEISAMSAISLSNLNQDSSIDFIDEGDDLTDRSKMNKVKDTALEEVHVNSIIKKFEQVKPPEIQPRTKLLTHKIDCLSPPEVVDKKPPEIPNKPKPQVYPRSLGKVGSSAKNRGHLDKAHSTPAYDLTTQLGIPLLSEEHVYNVEYPAKSIENEILGVPKSPNVLDVPPKPPPRINKPPAKLPENELQNKEINLPAVENLQQAKINQLNYNHPDVVPVLLTPSTSDYDHFQFDATTASSPIVKNQPKLSGISTTPDKHSKISTSTNNLVSMIYPMSKGRARKKNSLLAKRRNVSVLDVSPGEVQGFLFQRLRHKQTQNVHWEKRWFVLNSNCLYGFKCKESPKADCFIYLSGFTVTVANEVNSRTNAFKVYHTGTVFYFSAENSESQTSWIDLIASATLSSDSLKLNDQSFYSETDDDSSNEAKTPAEKTSEGSRKFNSLKKFARKRNDSSNSSVNSGSTSLDRKWFFNKTISSSKSSIPVKTDQFRSYRKISTSTTTGNFTSHIPNFAAQTKQNSAQNISSPNLAAIEDIKPSRYRTPNQIHNSNPSLATTETITCNFSTGQAAASSSKPNKNESLDGFVTLRELMYRQQEERKLNPHFQAQAVNFQTINQSLIRADVVYGEIPIRETKVQHIRTASDSSQQAATIVRRLNEEAPSSSTSSSCFGKRSGSSFKRSSSKNNSLPKQSNLHKDLSYEMIYCPLQQGTDVVQFAQNRKVLQQDMHPIIHHQYTPMTSPLGNNATAAMTPEERFQLDMATILPSSPLHSSGSGGKGKLKNKFFGGSSTRQDSTKQQRSNSSSKKSTSSSSSSGCQSPKLQQRLLARNLSAVQPARQKLVPDEYSWCETGRAPSLADQQHQVLEVQYPGRATELGLRHSPPMMGDYPGLEYPPVFEPETYSLADPLNTSLTLLRKQDSVHRK